MRLFLTLILALALVDVPLLSLATVLTEDTLSRLTTKAGQVKSIQAEFTQEKRLSIFKQTLISKGRFVFQRPASLRWEYQDPVHSGFIVHEESGIRWNALTGETRDFSLQNDPIMRLVSGQILLWTTLNLQALSRTYHIDIESISPAILHFTPLTAGPGPIVGMRITFTPDDMAIATIEMMETQGDTTTIRFHNTQLNDEIPALVFTRQ